MGLILNITSVIKKTERSQEINLNTYKERFVSVDKTSELYN